MVPSSNAKQEPKLSDILLILSDDRILKLFESFVVDSSDDNNVGRRPVDREQQSKDPNASAFPSMRAYYHSLGKLRDLSLIKRKKNRRREHEVTIFGMVVYSSVVLSARTAVYDLFWKLQAIDALYNESQLPREQHKKMIETLVPDKEIRAVLFRSLDVDAADSSEKNEKEETD